MKRDEQDRLLNEIISSEELAEFRRASLVQGLGAVQRQNRRRRALQTGALVILPALLALAVFLGRRHGAIVAPPRHNPDQVRNLTPPAGESAAPIKVITDDELLALFPDRSLALLGPPGQQQLVFLDKAKKPGTPRRM